MYCGVGRTLRRIWWIVFVVLVVGCCCSGALVVAPVAKDRDAAVEVTDRPWFAGFAGLLLVFVLCWLTFKLVRYHIRDWRLAYLLYCIGALSWAMVSPLLD